MGVACTFENQLRFARSHQTCQQLFVLVNQADAELQRFAEHRRVIDELAPGITPENLANALRLYDAANTAIANANASGLDKERNTI